MVQGFNCLMLYRLRSARDIDTSVQRRSALNVLFRRLVSLASIEQHSCVRRISKGSGNCQVSSSRSRCLHTSWGLGWPIKGLRFYRACSGTALCPCVEDVDGAALAQDGEHMRRRAQELLHNARGKNDGHVYLRSRARGSVRLQTTKYEERSGPGHLTVPLIVDAKSDQLKEQ